MPEDEIWDEERWEAFLRERDRRVDHYMDLLFGFLAEHPLPEEDAGAAVRAAWEAQLRAYLQSKGLRPEAHELAFLLSEENADDEEGADAEPPSFFDTDDDFEDEGFEDPLDDASFNDFRELPLYQHAFELATDVLEWANALPGDIKDSTLVQFCTHITQIPANIAKGHGIGYERDMIGGNIACAKRGLVAANEALRLLGEMKTASYMAAEVYRHQYEQAFEVRNQLGLYIQDLRRRFHLGID